MNPFEDNFSEYGISNWKEYLPNLRDNFIHLDSSSIGWGCCCLQVTMQAASFDESLKIYDQLIPLTPIFLGLSTACPIWRGYLSDIDSRWNVLSATTDDRTSEEIEKNLFQSSRYSSVYSYLSESSIKYNDIELNIDFDVYQKLIEHDFPPTVARHFANLFLRDPLYVTDEQVYPLNDESTAFAFENQNSMIWNSLRFKPPCSGEVTSMGWRIEFRPMELQLSDFENAALAVFLTILTRAILTFKVDLRMTISRVNDNMERAQRRNTIKESKFHFPTTILPDFDIKSNRCDLPQSSSTREMSMDEIINGSNQFIGLKTLVEYYLNSFEDIPINTRLTIDKYIQFISQCAKGTLLTNAMWIREFVVNHPLYRHDSQVNDKIQYDLIWLIQRVANGQVTIPIVRPDDIKSSTLKP